jgi:hypothetical protein
LSHGVSSTTAGPFGRTVGGDFSGDRSRYRAADGARAAFVSRGDGTRSIDRVPVQDLSDTYYVSLLRFLGCTSEASADAALNGGDELALYKGLAPSLMGAPSELIGWMLRHLAEGQPPLTRARALGSALTDPK